MAADVEDEVGLCYRPVGTGSRVGPDDAEKQWMSVGDGMLGVERGGYGYAGQFRKLQKFPLGSRCDDPATGDDYGFPRSSQQGDRGTDI